MPFELILEDRISIRDPLSDVDKSSEIHTKRKEKEKERKRKGRGVP